MAECKHDRVAVLRVLGEEQVVAYYLDKKEPAPLIYWLENCNHCNVRIMNRARADALPDRVERYLHNHKAQISV